MKILLVAPQSPDTALGMIGGYCKQALKNLDYDFEIFDFRQSQYLRSPLGSFLKKGIKKFSPFPPRKAPLIASLETKKMNKSLLAHAKRYRPDILLVLLGDNIFAETLVKLKRLNVIIANWFIDPVNHPKRRDFAQEISGYYDYFFLVESEDVLNYVKINTSFVKTILLGCAPQVHKGLDLSEREKKIYGNKVCFVGTLKYNREKILTKLANFDLGIWGSWSKKIPELRGCYRKQHVYAEEAVKIYNASDIVLDFLSPYGGADKIFGISDRIFEVPACGAFLLAAHNPYISRLYEIGKEIICYKDEKELLELVKYYLSHPDQRKSIAQKGQQRALGDHTYEKRLKEMFSIIEKNQENRLRR